jgi:mannose-6-phosphate isomerase
VSAQLIRPEPFRIEPIFVERIWGACSLAPLFPEKSNLAEPIGEAWLTSLDGKIASGKFAGKTLGEAWREMPAQWRGTRFASPPDFPILVKFIFPKDKLSIQVHPSDAYAAEHEKAAGGRGKTEMWHVISAEPSSKVLVGLKPSVDKTKFRESLERCTLEELFQAHGVQAGDTFFIPAGTPHTIGPGMILCEVQQYSDLTYRLYDYGRIDSHGKPRELHIAKAIEVMRFDATRGGKVTAVRLPAGRAKKSLLAACRYFASERWEFRASVQTQSAPEQFELYIILQGTGDFHWQGSSMTYKQGQCWFIPAALGRFSLQPEQSTTVVRTYVPDLVRLAGQLRHSGLSRRQLAQAIFD